MLFETILVLALIRHIRKILQTKTLLPQWDKGLLGFMIAAITLIVAGTVVHIFKTPAMWLAHILAIALLYIIFTKHEFHPAKSVAWAVLPAVAISFINDITEMISPVFYKKVETYFDTAMLVAFLCGIGIWVFTSRQRKALEQERLKMLQIEEENRRNESIKAMLEVQVAERTAAITQQKEELQHTLAELKATQAQLVQSEKMASLGELTAGIAHEIQNPLNFVNNFSEVSVELIKEMADEIEKGNTTEIKAIAGDLVQNLEKINHHGKRADAIVKGMLQHSRTSSGQKELTNINELCDEYLRLAFHGLRAKDKSFNAKFETDFDNSIQKINIVPQDIGRVILNLINNAFYAVSEKRKMNNEKYEPTVSVSTKKAGAKILISVADNGNGIPQKVLDKIFQPFFTTKPTGQGTGLGLSLSYDIIKAHGGEIKVETKELQGTEFIISLPLKDTL